MTLQFAGLKPRTVQSYRRAIRNFFRYLDDEELPVPGNSKRLDQCVSLYLEHMWQDDQPITYAGHLMSGLKRFLPELRWRLPRAKQYYANWQSTHVTKQANPFPPGVIMAYTGLAVATRQYSLAALLLVSDFSFPPWRRACFTHCSKGCNRPRPRATLGGAAQDKDIPVEILLWLSWFRLF